MRFEQLTVGQTAEIATVVTDDVIRQFAAATGDVNPLHLDDAAAAGTRFGGRIAHGMLSAGFISAVIGTTLPGFGAIYMSQSLRFTRPVRIGDTITARVEVAELFPAKRRLRALTTCRNQRGELVLDGEAVILLPDEGA
jgi:3-hydroxybutyryl-CoA dehydratase